MKYYINEMNICKFDKDTSIHRRGRPAGRGPIGAEADADPHPRPAPPEGRPRSPPGRSPTGVPLFDFLSMI